MVTLESIPGIGKSALELLEAAGFRDIESLAKADAAALAHELERANDILRISKRPPARSTVDKWVATAREITGLRNAPSQRSAAPVNYEESPQVIAMLATAPFAIPLPARVLVENHLGVADIPPGILLNRYSGDLEVKTEERLPQNRRPRSAHSAGYVQIADSTSQKTEIDSSKFRNTDDMAEPQPKAAGVKTSPASDRIALLRAPRTSTNKGRSPESRWYIRGVMHSHPIAVYIGALVTVLLMVMVPVAVLSSGLLFLSGEMPEKFWWVPRWLLIIPVLLPLLGIAYLIWGLSSNCRICGQKLFTHRAHLKNSKAHRIPGLGYILPLCFQILVFRWFRCTHCGTPVRLKE